MKLKLLLIILFLGTICYSQDINVYRNAYKNAKHDTDKINALNDLVWEMKQYDLDSAIYFAKLHLALTIKNKREINRATAYNNFAIIYKNKGDYSIALSYCDSSYLVCVKQKHKEGISSALNTKGNIYRRQGDLKNALDCNLKSLKIKEELKDTPLIATSLGNIGIVYTILGDFDKALSYQFKSLAIREKIGKKNGIAIALTNIGNVYFKMENFEEALVYHSKALKYDIEMNDQSGIANDYTSLGLDYKCLKKYDKALENYFKALEINRKIKEDPNVIHIQSNIASLYYERKEYKKAITCIENTFKEYPSIGELDVESEMHHILFDAYKKINVPAKALYHYEIYVKLKDSLINEENTKQIMQKQFQYDIDKKSLADSIKNQEEQKVKNAEIAVKEAQLKSEKFKSYGLYGGLALMLIFAGFIFNRFKVSQKQNVIIQNQKHLVEEKHKEITDSINYAERIQRSFLATQDLLDSELKNYFVLFQPKDVVSGDFYWASRIKNDELKINNFLLCTADSTGHGVPGAIMSILNISSLEKAIDKGLSEPAEILNHTRTTIIERLKKDGSIEGGKDGMDCSLICFDFTNYSFKYASANNPIWVIREKELIELIPDKMPVGKHDKDMVSFTQHEFNLQKGDTVYTLTDGFPDQFGGPKGKKFMYKRLKELLVEISVESITTQKEILQKTLNDWKANIEQVDDITLIGFRV